MESAFQCQRVTTSFIPMDRKHNGCCDWGTRADEHGGYNKKRYAIWETYIFTFKMVMSWASRPDMPQYGAATEPLFVTKVVVDLMIVAVKSFGSPYLLVRGPTSCDRNPVKLWSRIWSNDTHQNLLRRKLAIEYEYVIVVLISNRNLKTSLPGLVTGWSQAVPDVQWPAYSHTTCLYPAVSHYDAEFETGMPFRSIAGQSAYCSWKFCKISPGLLDQLAMVHRALANLWCLTRLGTINKSSLV